jgi:hypothetical protein
MLRVSLRNSAALETIPMSGPFSKLFQNEKQCVYNIPSDCGRHYIVVTSRPLEVCVKEHKYNRTQGLLEKSKLAQHAYKEGQKIWQKEAKVLQIEPNTIHKKYEEYAHMSLIDHSISQPSLDISPIWTPVITEDVRKLQLYPVYIKWEHLCFYVGTIQRIYLSSDDFYPDSTGARPHMCGFL